MKLVFAVDGNVMTTEFGTEAEAMRAFYKISGAADLVQLLNDRGHAVLTACPNYVFPCCDEFEPPLTIR